MQVINHPRDKMYTDSIVKVQKRNILYAKRFLKAIFLEYSSVIHCSLYWSTYATVAFRVDANLFTQQIGILDFWLKRGKFIDCIEISMQRIRW